PATASEARRLIVELAGQPTIVVAGRRADQRDRALDQIDDRVAALVAGPRPSLAKRARLGPEPPDRTLGLALADLEVKARADPRLTLDPDHAAVGVDDRLGDRQPEPAAAGRAGVGLLELRELAKQLGQLILGDARALVADREPHGAGRDLLELDPDGVAGLAELDRVRHQIDQHLQQPIPIAADLGGRLE